eukprot:5317957-Prymnesium_polylepis.2
MGVNEQKHLDPVVFRDVPPRTRFASVSHPFDTKRAHSAGSGERTIPDLGGPKLTQGVFLPQMLQVRTAAQPPSSHCPHCPRYQKRPRSMWRAIV